MKKPIKRLLLVLFTAALICSLGAGVFAAKVDDLKEEKQEIDAQIKDKQEDLESNKDAQNAAQSQLDSINASLDAVQAEITKLYDELAVAEENLARQQEEYNAIKAKLDESQKALQNRVNAIYRNGDISYWDVLFRSENVQDFISGFIFLTKIVEEDQKIIDSIQENKVLAEEKLHELEVTRNEIVALQVEKEAEEAEYAKQAEAKLALLDTLESEQAALEKEIDEMESQSGSIASEINSYYASLSASDPGYTYTGNGIFTWPLSTGGTLTSNYGYRIHPISGVRKMHTGIDLAAPAGTPILAAESGTVSLVRKLGTGYGWYVVVSHGSNISTLYAHMSSIIVSEGQAVSRGQKLGGVGTTGSSTGNHLHFEVRVNGSHVSPWGYISR